MIKLKCQLKTFVKKAGKKFENFWEFKIYMNLLIH